MLEDSCRKWEGLAVIFWSLGHRVLLARVAKEVRLRLQLPVEPEVYPVGEDHVVLRVGTKEECDRILVGGAWYVAG